ncbi:synaptic vesicle glycoprotein 2B-like isoform X1 [Maniola jurtina]|uniref:synaptic vesicle glycoprotein 2B-like isoform X1 n=1 Tax=Maniola jurtina TaxID=191418 RepID=UPI001E68F242|nr:synaptic vesicle glycoprotein 2B-like isoform X1 [Maniola jurtina]
MSEINLQALAGKDSDEHKAPTAMQEVNLALKECGFGLFHFQLLCTSFFGCVSGIVVTNSAPYILPIAECDLNMNLLAKGVLNAIPFFGLILISLLAGFLTDTFGRKYFVLLGFGGLFVFTLISGTSQNYIVLITAKFFEGMLFGTSFSSLIALTAEFCHNDIRDRIMILQSSFTSIAQVITALLSWGILTQDWSVSYFNGAIVLHNWNFYLFVMSLWPLLATILYCFLPESPKYYITQQRYDEAREVLIKIYTKNTGKSVDEFQYKDLWKDKKTYAIDETPENSPNKNFAGMLTASLHNVKPMFQKPRGLYLLLFCVMSFFTLLLYNVIRLWFPQLSTIVEHYSRTDSQDLCVMLDSYTHDLALISTNVTEVCVPVVGGAATYINSMILGSACLGPVIISSVLVVRVGKKNLYIACGLISVGVTLGLRWASSKVIMVALFASDMAIAQMMVNLNQYLVVEFFPTTMRSLAIGMVMMWGRIGSLVGNVLFPILLDMGCVVPFYTLAGTMVGITFLSFVIPVKKN